MDAGQTACVRREWEEEGEKKGGSGRRGRGREGTGGGGRRREEREEGEKKGGSGRRGRRRGRRREGAGGGGEKKGGNGRVARKSRGRRSETGGKKRDGRVGKGEEGCVCVGGWGARGGKVNHTHSLLQLMHIVYLQFIIRGHHLQFIEFAYLLGVHVLLQLPCGIFVWERAPLDEIVCHNLTIGLCL